MRGKARTTWKVRPMPRRHTWFGSKPVKGDPAKLIVPRSAVRNPLITLNKVVLPAPFGPMMP